MQVSICGGVLNIKNELEGAGIPSLVAIDGCFGVFHCPQSDCLIFCKDRELEVTPNCLFQSLVFLLVHHILLWLLR